MVSTTLRGAAAGALCLALLPGCKDSEPGATEGESGSSSSAGETGEGSSGEGSTGEGVTGEPPAASVTWHEHVAPIVVGKCSTCHRDGGIAPFALTSYAEAAPWAGSSLSAIESGAMPPFLADETDECQPTHGWQDDPRLTDDELELMRAWVEAGAPEGDPKGAAPLPEPPRLALDDADVRVQISAPVTIDGGSDEFLCFSLDPGFTEDTWIDAVQISAGNEKIVHHVLAYTDPTGESAGKVGPEGHYPCFGGPGVSQPGLIAAWAPGSMPFYTPEGVGMRVTAGSRIVLNVHYHPTGAPEQDASTSLDLRTRDTIPEYVGLLQLIGNADGSWGPYGLQPGPGDENGVEFRIPAGAADHVEQMLFPLNDIPEVRVFAAGTHMHYVGTDMLFGVQRKSPAAGEPSDECLLQTPRWSFEWQRTYAYDAPLAEVPRVRDGDELYLRCKYNNSMSNPHVVRALAEQGLDAPHDVHLGEETLDEMCLAVLGVAVALKDVI